MNGVLLFGSIGEFYSVSLADKEAALEFAVKRVGERMKVFAGVGDTTYANVIEFTKFAEKAGADAVLAVSPYYFGPSPLTAENYFGGIAEATKLPVILYNFPARTGTDLTPELVASLAAEHPNICGIKDTVDTISHTRKVIRAARAVNPDFTVFSGFDEYYLVNRVSGGNGVLCGLTNVEPETFVKMHAAYEEGDFATAVACAERISKLMAVYDVCDLFVSAIKAAVKVKACPSPRRSSSRPSRPPRPTRPPSRSCSRSSGLSASGLCWDPTARVGGRVPFCPQGAVGLVQWNSTVEEHGTHRHTDERRAARGHVRGACAARGVRTRSLCQPARARTEPLGVSRGAARARAHRWPLPGR